MLSFVDGIVVAFAIVSAVGRLVESELFGV